MNTSTSTPEYKSDTLYAITLTPSYGNAKFNVICKLKHQETTPNNMYSMFDIVIDFSNWKHGTFTLPDNKREDFEVTEIGLIKDHPEYYL